MTHILVFGDSTTYGANDTQGGWVQRIRKRLDVRNIPRGKYFLTYNMGISGGNTTQMVKRFKNEASIRLDDDPKESNIFIFSGGGNDAMWLHAKKKNWIPLSTFKRNIHTLIRYTRNYSPHMLFVGLKPCDESKVNPIPWHPIGSYRMKQFERYNDALKTICAEEKVAFLDVFSKFNNKKFISTLEDGIHPNDRGHAMMEKVVWEKLKKKGWV